MLARLCACMFSFRVAAVVIAFIVVAHACYYQHRVALSIFHYHSLTTMQICAVWVGAYLAVLVHEIGHASACARFGVKPGTIGLGFYWLMPIMFTDTSDAWRLHRNQRAIVDLGGIYFHLTVSALIFVLRCGHPGPVATILIRSILLSTWVNLNPILRFDGYWLLADLLGVPNLSRLAWDLPALTIRHLRLRTSKWPSVYTNPPWLLGVLVAYMLGSVGFLCTTLIAVLFVRLPTQIKMLPHQLATTGVQVWHYPTSLATVHSVFLVVALLHGMQILSRIIWLRLLKVKRIFHVSMDTNR